MKERLFISQWCHSCEDTGKTVSADRSALLDGGAVGYLILLQKSCTYEVRCWHQVFGNFRRQNCGLCWCILLFPLSSLPLDYQYVWILTRFETCSPFFQLSVTGPARRVKSSTYVKYKGSLLAQVLLCWSLSLLYFLESNLWLPLHRVWKFLFIIILSKKIQLPWCPTSWMTLATLCVATDISREPSYTGSLCLAKFSKLQIKWQVCSTLKPILGRNSA